MDIYECFYKSYDKEERICAKLDHYLEIYNELYKDIRNKKITFLEIGIKLGGSIKMWKNYFPKMEHFIGIDIDPECKKFSDKNTEILIGDQSDKIFLSDIDKELDIVLDDGGHQFRQQINSFLVLFKKLKENSIYIIEDTHSSYDNYSNIYPKDNVYGGGRHKKGTTIEFFKNLSDEITAWSFIKEHGTAPIGKAKSDSWLDFLENNNLEIEEMDYFRENIFSITFYDSIIAIKKKKKRMPFVIFNDNKGEKFIYHDKKK